MSDHGKKQSASVFTVMEKAGLTTAEIFYNRKKNKFLLRGAKEWDDSLQFRNYVADFTYVDVLTSDYKAIGTDKLLTYFKQLGIENYLEQIKGLIIKGGHEGIEFYYHCRKDIRIAFCKHCVAPGIRNRQHAIRAGAMRRHDLDEPEIEMLIDGLNLSRSMTYKNASASLPYGGCKTLVKCAPVKLDDYETMGFLAYIADRCRSFPGADLGFTEEMADIIRERYTHNFIGGAASPLVSSGSPTAYGEYLAIKEACDFVYGSPNLSNKKIAIQGLGHVGYPLAEYLLEEGAKLIVSDIDSAKVISLQAKYTQDAVQSVKPEGIYTVEADIFAPCAMGGIINEERLPVLKFKIILGSANNQLKATSKEAELELARKVAGAGILFVVDWAHNTGGVIAATLLWETQTEATKEKLWPMIESKCRNNFRELLELSRQTGKTPTELAYEKTEASIYTASHM